MISWRVLCLLFVMSLAMNVALRLENQTREHDKQLIASTAACKQPKAPGLCRGRQLRYAYNPQTGNCESFYYTGCASTENNFLTFEECRRDCMQRIRY